MSKKRRKNKKQIKKLKPPPDSKVALSLSLLSGPKSFMPASDIHRASEEIGKETGTKEKKRLLVCGHMTFLLHLTRLLVLLRRRGH